MYKLDDIKQIHLEITQKCQAYCGMCDRNKNGGEVNQHLTLSELKIDDIKHIFKPKFVSQLHAMQLCGNHGDPIVAEHTLETFAYFRQHNPNMWFSMNTNAGAREPDWWAELARVFGRMGTVIFSVDGLEDTNHLYRAGVQWSKVQRSFESFIAAGGRARWDFLVFDYNEHQTELAKERAAEWGFERFRLKKSSRFITGHSSQKKEEHQTTTRKGEESIVLKEPTKEENKNKVLSKIDIINQTFGSMDNYYDVSEIQCRVKDSGSMYVSAEGIVMPCCWTAGRMYKWWHDDPRVEQIWRFIDASGGVDALNANKRSLTEIFNTGIFDLIEKSWAVEGCNKGKLKVCAMKCSKDFDVVGSQYEQ